MEAVSGAGGELRVPPDDDDVAAHHGGGRVPPRLGAAAGHRPAILAGIEALHLGQLLLVGAGATKNKQLHLGSHHGGVADAFSERSHQGPFVQLRVVVFDLLERDGGGGREGTAHCCVTPHHIQAVLQLGRTVAKPRHQHGSSFRPLVVEGVINPDVFGSAVLGAFAAGDVHFAPDGAGAALFTRAWDVGTRNDLAGFMIQHVDLVAHEGLATEQQQGLADLAGSGTAARHQAVVLQDLHFASYGVGHDLLPQLVAGHQLLAGHLLPQVGLGQKGQAHGAQQLRQNFVASGQIVPDPAYNSFVDQRLVLYLQLFALHQLQQLVFGQSEEVFGLAERGEVGQRHPPGQLQQPLAAVGVRQQQHVQAVPRVEILLQKIS